jgi:hypothetical protein
VFRRHEAADDLQELALVPGDLEDGRVFLPKVMERWFGATRSECAAAHRAGRRQRSTASPWPSSSVPLAALAGRRLKAGKSAAAQGLIKGL